MTLLHIALQEGFVDDTIVVTVNGTEVFRKTGVNTRHQIGLADSFELDISEDNVTVSVSLPSRDLLNSIRINLPFPLFLGVSITMEDQVSFSISSTPFGYL